MMSIPMINLAPTPSPALANYNILQLNQSTFATRLKKLPKNVLIEQDEPVHIEVSHYDETAKTFTNLDPFTDPDSFRTWLNSTKSVPLRFISIPQQFSKSPLRITKPLLQRLFLGLAIDPAFLSVIAAFGDKPRVSESGYDCFNFNEDRDGSYSYCYLHRFMDNDEMNDDYQLRQVGVYHKYDKRSDSHTFIFLQPHESSDFDSRVDMARRNPDCVNELINNPLRVHEILLDTYFDNWRWFVKSAAEEFQMDSDRVFTADIHKATFNMTFEVLQSWRDLADRTFPLTAYFAAEERLRTGLRPKSLTTTGQVLDRQINQLTALTTSTTILLSRIQNVISLLGDTINIRNQTDSATLNGHLYNLTQDTVDDSASVRILTFVGLIYLPATFAGTLFGMNFFEFDSDARKLVIAQNFWLYVAIFVPLTVLTVGFAGLWRRWDEGVRKKGKKTVGPIIGLR